MADDIQELENQGTPEGDASSEETNSNAESTDGESVDELAQLKSQLADKEAALDKLNRDYSSLKGQLKPQLERDAELRDEVGAIHKQMALVTKALASGETEGLSTEYQQVVSEMDAGRANRSLQRFYDEASEEIKQAVVGEDGTALLNLEDEGPEIARVRALWQAGQSGKANDRQLTVDERINYLSQAVGEIHKLARAEERKQLRASSEKEKATREAERKAAREESGELDLDAGPGALSGNDDSDLSPRERIERGLARAKKTGKKSTIFAN